MGRKKTGKSDRVKQLYESGRSIEEIARELGYKTSSVKTILGCKGVKRRKFTRDYHDTIAAMAAVGKSTQEIAGCVGISAYSISKYMHEAGIRDRSRQHQAVSEEMMERMLDNLQFAEERPPVVKKVECGGKRWVDVTDYYLGW